MAENTLTIPIDNTPASTTPPAVTAPVTRNEPSTAEATRTLNQFGINPAEVLSARNVQQTIQQPTAAPDDLLGIRSDIYGSLGVNTAQQDYLSKFGEAQAAATQLGQDLTALSNRPVSVSKFTGQQSQLERTRAGSIEALQNAANLALAQYQSIKNEADTQFEIRQAEVKQKQALMLQYPGAGIKYSDSFEKSIDRIDEYAKEQEKKAYKDQLKQIALEMGIGVEGLSRREIERKIKKVNKRALERAEEQANLQIESMKLDIQNTKSIISNRGGGGSDLLSISEAAALGVPYGTTKDQAASQGITPDGGKGSYSLELDDPNDPFNTIYYNPTTKESISSSQILKDMGINPEEVQQQDSDFSWWNPTTWF